MYVGCEGIVEFRSEILLEESREDSLEEREESLDDLEESLLNCRMILAATLAE